MMVNLCLKNGYEEIKDDAGDVERNRSISIIWTECSRILSQGTNWGAFSLVLNRQGKEFIKFFSSKPRDKPVGFEQIRVTQEILSSGIEVQFPSGLKIIISVIFYIKRLQTCAKGLMG
jgi:hypothetical protein